MEFTTWLQQWLARHPLKMRALDADARARFTERVMQRVQAPSPASVPGRRVVLDWLRLPQLAFGVAAALLVAVLVGRHAAGTAPISQRGPSVEERALIVAALNDPTSDVLAAVDEQALGEELMAQDMLLMLAEAAPTADEQWLDQTLELLQQFDEDVSSDGGDATDEDWLQDLQLLDDAELSTRS